MELTNLMWHLGALLASVWAGFAYRGLLQRQKELEEAVLVSLLQEANDNGSAASDGMSARQLAHIRSTRARALRWFCDEFLRRYSSRVRWGDSSHLLLLPEEQWRMALSGLYVLLRDREDKLALHSSASVLTWQANVHGSGKWLKAIEMEKHS
jgi:hypothetical protein